MHFELAIILGEGEDQPGAGEFFVTHAISHTAHLPPILTLVNGIIPLHNSPDHNAMMYEIFHTDI